MSQCSQCNADLPEGAHFCPSCGAEYQEPVTAECVKCGAELPEEARFCPSCGTEQVPTISLTPTAHRFASSTRHDQAAQKRAHAQTRRQVALIAGVAVGVLAIALVGFSRFLFTGGASGVLTSQADGAPVSGAVIKTSAGTAVTTPSGRFHIEGLRPGTAKATIVVGGLAPYATSLAVNVIGSSEQHLSLPCASALIKLSESAPKPGKVSDAEVRVAGAAAIADAGGVYRANVVQPGKVLIEASGESYEATQGFVQLSSGVNQLPLTLSLTPKATFLRYNDAFKAKDWKAAYAYLAPAVRAQESFATFKQDMLKWGTPLSVEITKVQMLPTWSSQDGKAYTRVAAITRTLTGRRNHGGRYSSTSTQHWANVNGVWLRADMR